MVREEILKFLREVPAVEKGALRKRVESKR
jgi:hypothetical protein